MERNGSGRFAVLGIAVLMLLVAGAWWAANRPPETAAAIGADEAVTLARAFFVEPDSHGAGFTVDGVTVGAVTSVDAGAAWTVEISGDVTEAGKAAPTYRSHMILRVDANTRIVTVVAQG